MPEQTSPDRLVFLVKVFSLLAFCTLVFFGAEEFWVYNRVLLGFAELLMALAVVVNIVALYLGMSASFARNTLICIVIFGLVIMQITGGLDNTGIFWFYVMPTSVFFLAGRRGGIFWMGVIFFFSLAVSVLQMYGIVDTPYSFVTIRQMLVSLFVASAMVYIYEMQLEREAVLLRSKTKELLDKEEKLHIGNNRLSAIISSIGDGVVVMEKNFHILLLNPRAQKLLGVFMTDVIGSDYREAWDFFKGGNKVPAEERPITVALNEKRTIVGTLKDDYYYQSMSGRKFPVAFSIVPFFSVSLEGVVIAFRDISEDKAINDARNSFISTAAHQLHTPLSTARWFLEMLLDGDAGRINKEQRSFAEHAYQSTERMTNVINMLLRVAQMEMGHLGAKPTSTDVKNLVHEIAVALPSLVSKSQRVNIVATPEPFPSTSVDQDMLREVFQNLISNSSRYAPEGSIITVSMTQKRNTTEFSVADTGIGIPEAAQGKIFEKFFRAENAVKLVPDGSGLGLSLVKSLVEGWRGKIWFTSDEGKGTTFYFTIPLAHGVT